MKVKKDLYRTRLNEELSELANKYLSSAYDDLDFFEEEIYATAAHLVSLSYSNMISKKELAVLLYKLDSLKRLDLRERAKEFEDIHELIEEELNHRAGEVAKKLQSGRSRNDEVATITRMKVRKFLLDISRAIIELMEALINRAEKEKEVLIIYRTHRRDAQISSLAHYWLCFVDDLARNFERTIQALSLCNRMPLGASACAGTAVPIDRYAEMKLLGFDSILENSLDAVSTRDFILDALNSAVCLMCTLSRLSEDLIHWSSKDIGIIELHDSHCSSSSIMPHKKNPDVLEMLKARTSEVIAGYYAIAGILCSLPSGYNRELQRTKHIAVSCLSAAKDSLLMMIDVIRKLSVNPEKAIQYAKKSEAIALDITEYIMMKKSIPFRDAYNIVAELVKKLEAEGRLISELNKEEIMKYLNLKEEDLEELKIENILKLRKSQGSPNPSEVERMISERKKLIEEFLNKFNEISNRIETALSGLRITIYSMIKAYESKSV